MIADLWYWFVHAPLHEVVEYLVLAAGLIVWSILLSEVWDEPK